MYSSGTSNVVVWVDVDHNGIVSPMDTVIEGITVVLDRLIGQATYTGITDMNGAVNGLYPSGNYLVSVDSTILPADLLVVNGVESIADTVCGMVTIDLLLESACPTVFI